MEHQKFNEVLEARINSMRQILSTKAGEYATDVDRLANFKDGAEATKSTPEKFLWNLVTKHMIATRDFIFEIDDGDVRSMEYWDEKLGDIINYMVLLEALVDERLNAPETTLLEEI